MWWSSCRWSSMDVFMIKILVVASNQNAPKYSCSSCSTVHDSKVLSKITLLYTVSVVLFVKQYSRWYKCTYKWMYSTMCMCSSDVHYLSWLLLWFSILVKLQKWFRDLQWPFLCFYTATTHDFKNFVLTLKTQLWHLAALWLNSDEVL